MKTLDVKTCDDWELVLAANSPSSVTDLPENVLTEVLLETWKHQDGYGRPGRTPPQGWDFSGIRDSTPRAQCRMAEAVRRVLDKHGITTVTLTGQDV